MLERQSLYWNLPHASLWIQIQCNCAGCVLVTSATPMSVTLMMHWYPVQLSFRSLGIIRCHQSVALGTKMVWRLMFSNVQWLIAIIHCNIIGYPTLYIFGHTRRDNVCFYIFMVSALIKRIFFCKSAVSTTEYLNKTIFMIKKPGYMHTQKIAQKLKT